MSKAGEKATLNETVEMVQDAFIRMCGPAHAPSGEEVYMACFALSHFFDFVWKEGVGFDEENIESNQSSGPNA